MTEPAKKTAAKRAAKAEQAPEAPAETGDFITDMHPDSQTQADTYFTNLGHPGAYLHAVDQDGRGIYRASDTI